MRVRVLIVTLVLVGLLGTALPSGQSFAATADGAGQEDEPCTFPVTRTDATGTEVTVAEEPQRIVVLQASAAQVMWEIGAEERVVGMPVTPYTAYLNGSQNRTDVTAADGTPERETVVGLEPDLVLAPNIITNETVQHLREDGLTVYKADFARSLEGIYAKTSLFGRLVGRCEAADQTVSTMRSRVEEIKQAVAGEPRPRVLYTFYNFTVTEGTFIHEVIQAAGGDNVMANISDRGYPQVNEETIVERDPEWVVVPSDAPIPSGEPYASTTAYRQNQTLVVNTNYMNQPAPRVVQPMENMARAFHPAAFAQSTPTATATTTPAETQTDLPGFGLGVALGALFGGLALLVSRRARRF